MTLIGFQILQSHLDISYPLGLAQSWLRIRISIPVGFKF